MESQFLLLKWEDEEGRRVAWSVGIFGLLVVGADQRDKVWEDVHRRVGKICLG